MNDASHYGNILRTFAVNLKYIFLEEGKCFKRLQEGFELSENTKSIFHCFPKNPRFLDLKQVLNLDNVELVYGKCQIKNEYKAVLLTYSLRTERRKKYYVHLISTVGVDLVHIEQTLVCKRMPNHFNEDNNFNCRIGATLSNC